MTILEFLAFLVVAGICGSLGQAIGGYTHGGCLVSIVLGFVGALFGNWLSIQMGLPNVLVLQFDGHPFPVIWSIIGAACFVAVLGMVRRLGGTSAE